MIHIDIKKLGRFERIGHRVTGDRTGQSNSRGVGWEYVHVCMDGASRIAFSQILPDERKESAVAFLKAALAYYASLGITVSPVMTDNGSCYKSKAFSQSLPRSRPEAHPHQALYPQNQQQGRALHPDRAQGVGIRGRISDLKASSRRTPRLAASIQLASPARGLKVQNPNQPPRTVHGQPVECPQSRSFRSVLRALSTCFFTHAVAVEPVSTFGRHALVHSRRRRDRSRQPGFVRPGLQGLNGRLQPFQTASTAASAAVSFTAIPALRRRRAAARMPASTASRLAREPA